MYRDNVERLHQLFAFCEQRFRIAIDGYKVAWYHRAMAVKDQLDSITQDGALIVACYTDSEV